MNKCIAKTLVILLLIVVVGIYFALFFASPPPPEKKTKNAGLIVILGGFGQNQLDHLLKSKDGGFAAIKHNSTMTEYLQPIFPTVSQPNLYSLVTGVFAEKHGVTGDFIYDHERDSLIDPQTGNGMEKIQKNAEPFWEMWAVHGKKHKLYADKCAAFPFLEMSMECDNELSRSSYEEKLDFLEENINDALVKLTSNDLDVAIIYTDALREVSQLYGPLSPTTLNSLEKIDNIMKNLMQNGTNMKFDNHLNIVVASDHGLASVENVEHVTLEDVIDRDDIQKIVVEGAHVAVWPAEGKHDIVYSVLKNVTGVTTWTKDYIPGEFHYKNNDMIAPIQLVANKGFFVHIHEKTSSKVVTYSNVKEEFKGGDGYDYREVEEMRGIFIATGPDFSNGTIKPVSVTTFLKLISPIFIEPVSHGEMHHEHSH